MLNGGGGDDGQLKSGLLLGGFVLGHKKNEDFRRGRGYSGSVSHPAGLIGKPWLELERPPRLVFCALS